MEIQKQKTLPAITFDPNKFTSFGPPPESTQYTDGHPKNRSSPLRLVDSFLSNISSRFRRTQENVKPDEVLDVSSNRELDTSHQRIPVAQSLSGEMSESPTSKSGLQSRERRSATYRPSISIQLPFSSNKEVEPATVGLNAIWANDDTCYHCYNCSVKFTTFTRRHHCRFCGRIFCDNCSKYRIPGKPFGVDIGLRACEVCYRQTLRVLLEGYAMSMSDDLLKRLTKLYIEIQTLAEPGPQLLTSSPRSRTTSIVGPVQSSKIRSETTAANTDARSSPPPQGGQSYESKNVPNDEPDGQNFETCESDMSIPCATDGDYKLSEPQPASSKSSRLFGQKLASDIEHAIVDSLLQNSGAELGAYRPRDIENRLHQIYLTHLSRLCSHLLAVEQLDAKKWQKTILQVVYQVIRTIKLRPRQYADAIDIRNYTKIKKVFEPFLSAHFEYVDGLVFTKNICHRKMQTLLHNPRILLLESGLDFERECEQLTTLDMIVNQEDEQMDRYVSQIASVSPTVVLCGGSIPVLAVEKLMACGITAASFVKPAVLELIARYTGTEILASVDSLSVSGAGKAPVILGTCRTFASFIVHAHSSVQKTFICLSGCNPIGCTLLLRDNSPADLAKVKRILRWLLLTAQDGAVASRYMAVFRIDPFSLNVDDQPFENKKKLKNGSFSEFYQNENRGSLRHVRATSDPITIIKKTKSPEFKHQATAFDLANSGLLTMSPIIRLPDPSKRAACFDSSPSRVYFESSLFSLFGASFQQGNKPSSVEGDQHNQFGTPKCVEKALHEFSTRPLTGSYKSENMQRLMTQFICDGSMYKVIDDEFSSTSSSRMSSTSGEPVEKNPTWVKPLAFSECQVFQVLVTIFSPDSHLSPFHCCYGPCLEQWPFYAQPDLSLGAFLTERYFACSAKTLCQHQGCGALQVDHICRLASNSGRVDIVVRSVNKPVAISNANNSADIVTWSMCCVCKATTPVVQPGDTLYQMSFACYLQRKFDGIAYNSMPLARCQHAFETNYLQFFAKDCLVAVVKYSNIDVYDIAIPRKMTDGRHTSMTLNSVTPDGNSLMLLGNRLFDNITCYIGILHGNLTNLLGNTLNTTVFDGLHELQLECEDGRKRFNETAAKIEATCATGDSDEFAQTVVGLFRWLYLAWIQWNERLKGFVHSLRSSSTTSTNSEASYVAVRQQQQQTMSHSPVKDNSPHEGQEGLPNEVFATPPSASISSVASIKTFGKNLIERLTESDLLDHQLFRTQLKLPLEQPFKHSHHYAFENQSSYLYPVAVFDEEPSSLIAFMLSSDEYNQKLAELISDESDFSDADDEPSKPAARHSSFTSLLEDSPENWQQYQTKRQHTSETASLVLTDQRIPTNDQHDGGRLSISKKPKMARRQSEGATLRKRDKDHVTLEWQDLTLEKDTVTKFSVTAYHAAIFAEIRAALHLETTSKKKPKSGSTEALPPAELVFVRSMARCQPWKASGGKSGVKYFKTLDGQFILKQLQRVELQTFLEMAPHYLAHIKTTREQNRPSALVPIVGVFHVTLENAMGRAMKFDLIVMEYLFRSRTISEKFDLKGSQRNRYLKNDLIADQNNTEHPSTNPTYVDTVLLDENLLIRSMDRPLYVYPHAKKLLLQALTNDTLFLQNHSIMDYSLLVGIDTKNKSIVVGVIDYLRPYTWDKVIESELKLLGNRSKVPTVIEPKLYRNRFFTAMRHFFLEVPDHFLPYETHNLPRL